MEAHQDLAEQECDLTSRKRYLCRGHVAGDNRSVAYVISEPCIGTKDNSCVEVCPVDCIHPVAGERGFPDEPMLYINPAECIDCDACVEACPVDAISAGADVPEIWREYIQINADYYKRVVS